MIVYIPVITTAEVKYCPTRAQTPSPLQASIIPTTPENHAEITVTLAIALKLTSIVIRTLCIAENENIMIPKL